MDHHFSRHLDAALDHLYRVQYSKKELGFYGEKAVEEGKDPRSVPNSTAVSVYALFAEVSMARDKSAFLNFEFVLEHLTDDGMIVEEDVDGIRSVRLLNKGRLFLESKGYQGRLRRERWDGLRNKARTIASAINALAVIMLTLWAAHSADADRLKDEQIIQLIKDKAEMEARINRLEDDLRDRFALTLNHRDSL